MAGHTASPRLFCNNRRIWKDITTERDGAHLESNSASWKIQANSGDTWEIGGLASAASTPSLTSTGPGILNPPAWSGRVYTIYAVRGSYARSLVTKISMTILENTMKNVLVAWLISFWLWQTWICSLDRRHRASSWSKIKQEVNTPLWVGLSHLEFVYGIDHKSNISVY